MISGRGRSPSSRSRAGVCFAVGLSRVGLDQHLRDAQFPAHLGAGGAADHLIEDLGQGTGVQIGQASIEVIGDRETEHAVAEQGQTFVGSGPVGGPGGMGQGRPPEFIRQAADQAGEVSAGTSAAGSPGGAWTFGPVTRPL